MTKQFVLAAILGWSISGGAATAADRITLNRDNWEQVAPHGKEVDAIDGDIVLRNAHVVAVIAQPLASRNANMTVNNVGGCLIDFTTREAPSDQLGAYFPGGRRVRWQGKAVPDERDQPAVSATFHSADEAGRPAMTLEYRLADDARGLQLTTTYRNATNAAQDISPSDEIRADGGSFEKGPNGPASIFWVYDKWFDQAYAVRGETGLVSSTQGNWSTLQFAAPPAKGAAGDKPASIPLAPGKELKLVRTIYPAASLLQARALAEPASSVQYSLRVRDAENRPIERATISVKVGEQLLGSGRTAGDGTLEFAAPPGKCTAELSAVGSGSKTAELSLGRNEIALPVAGRVVAKIVDERGGPIACKVAFVGRDGTKDPFLGDKTCEHAVHNLYYSHDGSFQQPLEPGTYDVTISHGPEYDAEFQRIAVVQGQPALLHATLRRTVDTRGWISADFHSHSSPSGDNTSSQLGRVLNLLCEHLEFAPCTEHNRISSYNSHLEALGAQQRMATCSGIELTGSPLPLNHQNAFPLVLKPGAQDGGAPEPDVNPEVQIARLALWDSRSEKLVQQNHPDIGNLFFDKNGDGQTDEGFSTGLPFIDVMEVHPPSWIFSGPFVTESGERYNNTIFNWMQTLNQGRRVPGVVNTDAHYNFHGSGFLRIYLRSETDDPARIKTLDVVAAAKAGHIVMTSGPFLEVDAAAGEGGASPPAISGDALSAPAGKVRLHVRVQCPNWLDIDRVQVFVNGRPEEAYNFTREKQPDRFGGGSVKFDQELAIELKGDAHLIVAAAGEKLHLGAVMGPDYGKDMPIAVSNPIYVDVDGGGVMANGDTLGAPLPAKNGTRAETKKP